MTTLEEGRQLLARCRLDPAVWVEASCGEAVDDDGRWMDPHAVQRYALLLALQYDLQAEDRALVRYLVEHEAVRHRREPFQGLHPALRLAGYLLATFRAVEHVWLFAQAKQANFDTYAGFDREYLVSAGIEETLAYVRAADMHSLQHDVLEWLVREDGQRTITEDELDSWWQHMRATYPAEESQEDPRAKLDQALDLHDVEEARRWLPIWEATLSRTSQQLRTLAWYWAEVHDWDRAGTIVAEVLAHADVTTWDRASLQVTAATYHRQAGRAGAAWRQLVAARQTLGEIADWWKYGLGRRALEEALRIAHAMPASDEQAHEAYSWASEQLARDGVATLHLLEAAEAAAAHLGDTEGQVHFSERAVRERQRIDDEIGRLGEARLQHVDEEEEEDEA